VIMVTATPTRARPRGLELGAIAYVDKPFDLAHLSELSLWRLQPVVSKTPS